jgi:hypothetical protein
MWKLNLTMIFENIKRWIKKFFSSINNDLKNYFKKDQNMNRIWILFFYIVLAFFFLSGTPTGDIEDYFVEDLTENLKENLKEDLKKDLTETDDWRNIQSKLVGLSFFLGGIFIFFYGWNILTCVSDIFLNSSTWVCENHSFKMEIIPQNSYIRTIVGINHYFITSGVDGFYLKLFITEFEAILHGCVISSADSAASPAGLNIEEIGDRLSNALHELITRYRNYQREGAFNDETMKSISQIFDRFLKGLVRKR